MLAGCLFPFFVALLTTFPERVVTRPFQIVQRWSARRVTPGSQSSNAGLPQSPGSECSPKLNQIYTIEKTKLGTQT